jgi:hypothetical protein
MCEYVRGCVYIEHLENMATWQQPRLPGVVPQPLYDTNLLRVIGTTGFSPAPE